MFVLVLMSFNNVYMFLTMFNDLYTVQCSRMIKIILISINIAPRCEHAPGHSF